MGELMNFNPIRPSRGFRGVDSFGSGGFGAQRDGGTRKHLGQDYIALPGDTAKSPIEGRVSHVGRAYADADYGSVRIVGKEVEFRILYINPSVAVGETVKEGEEIGTVQDIAARYIGITPHVHVEVRMPVDPEWIIP